MFFNTLFEDLIYIAATLLAVIVGYYKWTYLYWERKNLPYLVPKIPFGNVSGPLNRKENLGITVQRFYNEMRSRNWKHGGVYLTITPVYVVTDLEYIKNVLSKDFQYFVDRGFYHNEKDDPLSAHLFAIGGTKWRNLRTKLTPTFTSGKMKMMFQTLVECESNLQEKILTEYENKRPIDIKEVLACFTTDIIGSCAFGLDCNSFKEDNSPFRMYGKKLFQSNKFRSVKNLLTTNFPDMARKLGVKMVPTDIATFFMKVVKDAVKYRETNNYARKDFLQLLIDMKNNNTESDKANGISLTIEEIAAQCFVFFLAGFETSSTTMTFALYELSKHQDLQDKLREEINTVLEKHNGKVTYEAINDMKYMNQVIDETLRKYPPVPFITRKCIKDYKVPNEDVVIEKGTPVFIPILGVHYDEEHYPNPEKFYPERFSEDNKKSRHNFTHMPFGEGPRLCIGMRFGIMQSKVGLTSLLKKYRFTVNQKTQEPLKMQVRSFVMAAEGEIWLNAEKI